MYFRAARCLLTVMKRILIYSHDTFGLGNIRRMLEVARHLVQSSPEVSVLVITGSPMLHAFRIPPRVDYVKLPCLSRNTEGRYAARYLDLTLDATVRLRANIISSTIEDFAPDLILVDKKPFGVEDEMAGALAALSERAQRPKLMLLLRDILDSPEATTRVWRKNGYFEAIEAYYDAVLVVGSPEVYDLRAEYAFPPFAAAKVQFCGYIAREPGRQSRAAVRQQLGVAEGEPLVLVTPGGGEDGHGLVTACLEGLRALPLAERPRTHIVCGPEMGEPARAAIVQASAALPNVSLQDFSDDLMSLMAAADVVLSMGGYNTVCELLTLHKRAVVVPRVKPVAEQGIRAARMAARGLLRTLHPQDLTPAALWRVLRAELRSQLPLPRLDAMHGLEHVTGAVFEAIGLPFSTPHAQRPQPPQRDRSWHRLHPTALIQ
jgi:predicted glycosyltransferase